MKTLPSANPDVPAAEAREGETWQTFPAQMGEHRAFITFNETFSRVADQDPNDVLVRVRAVIKKPTESGMPTHDEFQALSALDDKLENAFTSNGGTYVGKITVNGKRHFFYYITFTEDVASAAIRAISNETTYELAYVYEKDTAKHGYWNELYPSPDDWRMIKDLRVLDVLRDRGDRAEISRDVSHWAYFPDLQAANAFGEWATEQNYKVTSIESSEGKVQVRFVHSGTMLLEDITRRTITSNRKASELNGEYDGWETSVESQQTWPMRIFCSIFLRRKAASCR